MSAIPPRGSGRDRTHQAIDFTWEPSPNMDMDTDLTAHAATLGDPAAYFVDDSHGRKLVVESATGRAKFYLDAGGQLRAFDAGKLKVGLKIENPPGFVGWPQHDPKDPRWNLTRFAATIGNPAAYFVHLEADEPLVVEDATGTPRWKIGADGNLKPLAPPKPAAAPAAKPGPAPAPAAKPGA